MAHKRADTLSQIGSWARHLRADGKRLQARAERAAGRREIRTDLDEGPLEPQTALDADDDGEDVSATAGPATGAVADLWLLAGAPARAAVKSLQQHTLRDPEECRALLAAVPVRLLVEAPVEEARRLARAVAACCTTEVVLRGERVVCIDPKDPARGDQQVVRLLRSGSSLIEEKGRMGSRGVVREQVLGSTLAAERELARRVVSLLADGWLVCEDETEALQAVSARHPELEAAAESGRASAAVLSDWWQAQGDPRGELAAVGLALEERPNDFSLHDVRATLLHKHRAHLLGELADQFESCGWHRGFLDWVSLDRQPGHVHRRPTGCPLALWSEVLRWLRALPAAARLQSIWVECDPEGFLRELADTSLPRSVRGLGLGPAAGSAYPVIGQLRPVLGGDLEWLEIRGRIIRLPTGREMRLRRLGLDLCASDPLLHPLFEELSRQAWPCLEDLVIKVGLGHAPFSPQLGALLGTLGSFPKLRRLQLSGIGTVGEFLHALLWPPALEVLELAHMEADLGHLSEGDYERLLQLKQIDLHNCQMPREARAQLREQFPNLVAPSNRGGAGDAG